ncbi:hypothetical protein [Pseudobacillus wudalianchiensis]|uniref:hypothetical protein n=1 Tax=Pseudobacillus wudalianchiensis TaxID=1743143 RepID=UPI0008087592|nr:hypothetical protein [Bacillus wudalianchiensis]
MVELIKIYIGEPVALDLLGKKELSGILVDFGSEVLILYRQDEYFYIPLFHIRGIRSLSKEEADTLTQPDKLTEISLTEELSLKKVLEAAKGVFLEINVTAAQPFHGYITNILDDYVVFFSPTYQTMLIPFQHIKWLIPYPPASHPYGFKNTILPATSTAKSFARTFASQIEKMAGAFITCNVGEKESKSGKLLSKGNHFVHLLTAKERQIHISIPHIKNIICP